MNNEKTEYKVMSGKLMLGRTSDYNEAIAWMKSHDKMKARNSPYARIVEVN